MNQGGGSDAELMDEDEEERLHERSPWKKKTRKEKPRKKKKKAKKRGKDDITSEEQNEDEETTTPSPSILKGKGKVSSARKGVTMTPKISYITYEHKNKRLVAEASIVLGQDDKYTELTMALRTLFSKFKKKDKTVVFCSHELGEHDPLEEPSQIPLCNTELSNHIVVSGGLKAFQMKKPWGYNKDTTPVNEEGLADPEVYLAFSFSCDKDPRKLLDAVSAEWGKLGGNKMFLKNVAAYTTVTPIVIFHMINSASPKTILAELNMILEKIHDIADNDDFGYEYRGRELPFMAIRVSMPKIDGQDTSVFKGLKRSEQDQRKCIHVECADTDVPFLQFLVTKAKEMKLFIPVWGRLVKLTAASGFGTKPQDIAAMTKWVRMHINLHSSLCYDGIHGILGLDVPVTVFSESDPTKAVGEMTLRYVMYNYVKLSDGSSLFAEIHQENPMMDVEVVVANIPEAERMVAMINKQPGVFFGNYLVDQKLPKSFSKRLVKASICPSLLHGMHLCSWESKTMTITTPEDEEEERMMAIEKASWYKDTFGDHLKSAGKREQKEYVAPEMLYDIDGVNSVNTIHERPGKRYGGTPGAEKLNLGGKSRTDDVIDVNSDDDDNMSRVSAMSRDELIALVKQQAKISSGKRGSAPRNVDTKSYSDSSAAEEGSRSSDGSSSSDSSSSNSSVEISRDRNAAKSG